MPQPRQGGPNPIPGPLENGTFAVGVTVYPLATGTGNSLLQDGDAPLYWLLDFLSFELNYYIGSRWTSQLALAGRTDMPNIVGTKFPNNPFPYLQDSAITFPLFAIYRVEGKFKELTSTYERIESEIEIAWVLPPLTIGQVELISPFKNSVLQVLQDRAEYGYDPNYMDGYNYGLAAGFDSITMNDYTYGMIPHTTTNLPMESVVLRMRIRERNNLVIGAYEQFAGVDTEFDLVSRPYDKPSSANIDNFVDTNSNKTPHNFP